MNSILINILPGTSTILAIIFILNIIVAFAIIFIERKNPTASLAWVMILFLLPGVGLVFYTLLSQNFSRQKISRLSTFEELKQSTAMRQQRAEMSESKYVYKNPAGNLWHDLILLNQKYSTAFYTQNNRAEIFTDGKEKFKHLFADIENATSTINIMYYIVKNDHLGHELIAKLTEKAAQGVEVRLLMDAIGSRQIFEKHLKEFKEAGGKVAFFFPPKFKYFTMKLNYRNHRKLAIFDNRIGYIGGFNVGKEYIGQKKKFGFWRDTHIRLVGSCVRDLQARFILDWRFSSKENLVVPSEYYDNEDVDGNTGVQIVSSGPDTNKAEIKQSFLKMISAATTNIYIQTPYYVPEISIHEMLKTASLSGVDVRIMIPCMPDHMFVYWATVSYVGELLSSGVKIYIYNNGFLHAKTIAVDGQVSSVGSANFDVRSFRLNFEANAILYDEAATHQLEEAFLEDVKHSTLLTQELYNKRSLLIKFKESVSRLLSPLL